LQRDSPKNNGYQMINMDSTGNEPENPIIQAIKAGDSHELSKCLKKHGNLLEIRDGGETALHCAANNGRILRIYAICIQIQKVTLLRNA